jgi:spore coat polysaccharide biosynthesis protein SpsF (cytidylyltransferase family)
VTTASVHPACDYISFSSRDGQPAIQSPLGIFAEWCSAEALRKAHRQATSAADRAQVTRYLYSHPEKFHVRLIPVPAELDREDVRLRLDGEEDWEHTQAIYEALGTDECDWRRIAGLLAHQPNLRRRMAVLNREALAGTR